VSNGESIQAQDTTFPHLNDKLQLIVEGKPYFIIGGELGNSTASDIERMKEHWPKFKTLHMNTILAPVYWDRFEPTEGQFDFSLIDGLLEQARAHNMRLVLLWFGTWRNSMSCYVPEWVKRNFERFPRCRDNSGKPLEILSPLSEENLSADKRAFVALMRHLKEVDSEKHTVLMIQVENEIGMIPLPRDYSDEATAAYQNQVPAELFAYLEKHRDSLRITLLDQWKATNFRKEGNWEECFGPGVATEELFTAWNFARYTDKVAKAGKAEYPLPMFANAALIRENYVPGQYPSGGPLPHLVDIWRAGAPAIDFLAPDFYFPNFVEWCDKYDIPGNAYFIPEIGLFERTPTNILYAVGQQHVMGVSPFDIESITDPASHPLGKCY
jgi:beta-galactosidase GanA